MELHFTEEKTEAHRKQGHTADVVEQFSSSKS
jgi:hypothetical protein